MLTGDAVCRAALYPKFITPSGVFDEEALLNFAGIKGTEVYALSVASKFICRSDNGVHEYGVTAAEIANARFREKNGRSPEPIDEEVHYVGFYEFLYGDLIAIEMTHYAVHCYWLPENGLHMHFQAEFRPNGRTGSAREKRTDRRAAVGILATMLRGPKKHISMKDEPYREALEAIDLPALPRG